MPSYSFYKRGGSVSFSGSQVSIAGESVESVSDILTCLCLEMYQELFTWHEVDLETFKELQEEDLVEIGVESPSARQSLMQFAKLIK